MPKIAILVVSSGRKSLQYLLDLLDDRFFIVIHLDAKCGIDRSAWRLPPHAVFCPMRFPVFWGGFNLVLAIRECVRTALDADRNFLRYAVISDDTLPIVPLQYLERALLDRGREYMNLMEIANDPSLHDQPIAASIAKYGHDQPWRFQNYGFYDDELLSPRSRLEVQQKFGLDADTADYVRGSAERIVTEIFHHLGPREPPFPRLFYGSGWWALSDDVIRLIVDDAYSEAYTRYFRLFRVPDEHFFHCLVGNRARALAAMAKSFVGNMMYVDEDPERARFGDDALTAEEIRTAHVRHGSLFARKFNPERTPEIADAIERGAYFGELVMEAGR